ncbi:putative cuticle protein [Operophtera brumata]|uniref:Putative cuticle protein n=1 Tax=Operophtera brumata TaxID=104452 RepID=A0A0L7KZG2_OPEBR|nr:putative cuticle protein [Operophtera brumata]
MMKITIFVVAALAVVLAQEPAKPTEPAVTIVKQFELSDGTSRQEQGDYKNDTEQQGLSVKGSYKYVAPDGQHIAVTYLADKNGYQPKVEDDSNSPKPAQA